MPVDEPDAALPVPVPLAGVFTPEPLATVVVPAPEVGEPVLPDAAASVTGMLVHAALAESASGAMGRYESLPAGVSCTTAEEDAAKIDPAVLSEGAASGVVVFFCAGGR